MRVESFPDDNKLRVVYATGSVLHTSDFVSNPLVNVLVALTPQENQEPLLIQVPISDLDIVRRGSVWLGQKRVTIREQEYFKFQSRVKGKYQCLEEDFTIDEIPLESQLLKYKTKLQGGEYLVSFDSFNLPRCEDKNPKIDHKNRIGVRDSYCNVFENNGIQYVIPCMEIFSSLYAPMRKDLRRMIMTHTKEAILEKYVSMDDKNFRIHSDKEISLKLKTNLGDSSTVFLGHLLLSDYANEVFELIKLNIGNSDDFGNMYPMIKPYFVGKTRITGKGVWLNEDKTRMLVLRINSFLLPSDIKVKVIEKRNVTSGTENSPKLDEKPTVTRLLVGESELNIKIDRPAGTGSRKDYVLTEVQTTVSDGVITRTTELKYTPRIIENDSEDNKENDDGEDEYIDYGTQITKFITPEREVVTDVASGEKCTIQYDDLIEIIEIREKNPLTDPEKVPLHVFNAIMELKNDEDGIFCKVITYDGENSERYEDFIISYVGFPEIEASNWSGKSPNEYREILLLELFFLESKVANIEINKKYYLLEIIRQKPEDLYSGYLLKLNKCFDEVMLKHLLSELSTCKGRMMNADLQRYSIDIKPFTHKKGSLTWSTKMKRTLMQKFNLKEITDN